ncbi:MAG: Asp-tRNA(Asn)/Glu-tRNA(Gln) amidotransferase subunit GatC [Myxococcales bacterium]|nr:Asp-tRNA(Asn)/Glu-tRNA(Gln) amidotransferase subunit GatC [Myxococcales bacterium]
MSRAKISREEVLHLARLSRLRLDEAEVEPMRAELDALLVYMEELAGLELEGVEPTPQMLESDEGGRDDELQPSLDRALVLEAAPEVQDGAFAVPQVMERQ